VAAASGTLVTLMSTGAREGVVLSVGVGALDELRTQPTSKIGMKNIQLNRFITSVYNIICR